MTWRMAAFRPGDDVCALGASQALAIGLTRNIEQLERDGAFLYFDRSVLLSMLKENASSTLISL